MSIYATIFECADDLEPDGSTEFPPPVVYKTSAAMPDANVRQGYFEVGCIPDYVSDPASKHPFLRISLGDQAVLLDMEQVVGLVDVLDSWIVTQRGPIEQG